jgi:hypothetical protein
VRCSRRAVPAVHGPQQRPPDRLSGAPAHQPSPHLFAIDLGPGDPSWARRRALVRVKDGRSPRPIAGTRPRSDDPVRDVELEHELLADQKELRGARDARGPGPQRRGVAWPPPAASMCRCCTPSTLLARDAHRVGGARQLPRTVTHSMWCAPRSPRAHCRARPRSARCSPSPSSEGTPPRAPTAVLGIFAPTTWRRSSPSGASCSRTSRPTSRRARHRGRLHPGQRSAEVAAKAGAVLAALAGWCRHERPGRADGRDAR